MHQVLPIFKIRILFRILDITIIKYTKEGYEIKYGKLNSKNKEKEDI